MSFNSVNNFGQVNAPLGFTQKRDTAVFHPQNSHCIRDIRTMWHVCFSQNFSKAKESDKANGDCIEQCGMSVFLRIFPKPKKATKLMAIA